VQFVANGAHTWPTIADGGWNLDANTALWNFVDHYHL
jgi:hypothetical protein